jgi:hypothetical protein
MAEGFWSVMGRQLFVWAGWVFTVGGAIVSLSFGEGSAWIGYLVIAAGLLALTGHAYATHCRCRELEARNGRLAEQLRDADRKLNEIPLAILTRIQELVVSQSLTDTVNRLAAHADFVVRMRQFAAAVTGDIHLRTFVRRDGSLYATAKIGRSAISHLRQQDAFVLVRSSDALRTDCALMVVHQIPDAEGEVVHFRLVELFSDEARALDQHATVRDVSGLTGYTPRPACDTGWYATLESATISEAILRLAQGLERERRDRT